jgi:hypothetical protein
MSETIRYKPWAEPGAAGMTEHPEPGGVNATCALLLSMVHNG